jgi:hypothetical protein
MLWSMRQLVDCCLLQQAAALVDHRQVSMNHDTACDGRRKVAGTSAQAGFLPNAEVP